MHFAVLLSDFLSGLICSVETEAAAVHFRQNRIGAYSPWSRAESRDLIRNAVVVLVETDPTLEEDQTAESDKLGVRSC